MDEGAHIDVENLRSLCEVRRGNKSDALVDYDTLGVKTGPLGCVEVERAGVIVDLGIARTRPFTSLKAFREATENLACLGGVTIGSLHVQKHPHDQIRVGIHPFSKLAEDVVALVNGIPSDENGSVCLTKQLADHDPRVSRRKSGRLGAGRDKLYPVTGPLGVAIGGEEFEEVGQVLC
jgi:hypothetical protein